MKITEKPRVREIPHPLTVESLTALLNATETGGIWLIQAMTLREYQWRYEPHKRMCID